MHIVCSVNRSDGDPKYYKVKALQCYYTGLVGYICSTHRHYKCIIILHGKQWLLCPSVCVHIYTLSRHSSDWSDLLQTTGTSVWHFPSSAPQSWTRFAYTFLSRWLPSPCSQITPSGPLLIPLSMLAREGGRWVTSCTLWSTLLDWLFVPLSIEGNNS